MFSVSVPFQKGRSKFFRQGWIDAADLQKLAAPLAKNGYGNYLLNLLK